MISQEELKRILHYNPKTGIFTWLITPASGSVKKGDIAGCILSSGYIHIKINSRTYSAHRLAFLYITGSFPEKETDHINRTPSDNRWCNLREATPRQNQYNKGIGSNNTSGYKGVSLYGTGGKWRVRMKINGKYRHLGTFDDKQEASKAYEEATKIHHGEFAMVSS